MTPDEAARNEAYLRHVSQAIQDFVLGLPVPDDVAAFAAIAAAASVADRLRQAQPDLEPRFAAAFLGMAQTMMPGTITVEVETIPTPTGPAH